MIPSGATIAGEHTYTDLGMIPKRKIVFAPPMPKLTYTEVPGADGILDNTEVLTGTIPYSNRTGNIEFLVANGVSYAATYSSIMNLIHGKKVNVILDDDPNYFYTGRFYLDSFYSKEEYSTMVLNYDLEPYKYLIETTGSHDWLWDDLFDLTIYYGSFTVNGTKTRTFINPTNEAVTPKFTCSAIMSVTVNGIPAMLPAGTTAYPGFTLDPGENTLVFSGTGTVLADYTMGKSL